MADAIADIISRKFKDFIYKMSYNGAPPPAKFVVPDTTFWFYISIYLLFTFIVAISP